MAKVKKTTISTVEVDGKKAETYSLNTVEVKKLLAGETGEFDALDGTDIFNKIRLCDRARDAASKLKV